MIEVISDAAFFAPWVAKKIGFGAVWPDAAGYGFLDNGNLVGAVVFTEFTGRDVHVHVASQDSGWCQRRYLKFIAEYAFVHCGVHRASAITNETNEKAEKFCRMWGFKEEGRLREYFEDGRDAIVWGILKHECRYLNNGKKSASATTASS